MTEPDYCLTCKTGKALTDAYKAGKAELVKASMTDGHICALCIHNKIGKRKAWALKKVIKGFQETDMYQEVEQCQ